MGIGKYMRNSTLKLQTNSGNMSFDEVDWETNAKEKKK